MSKTATTKPKSLSALDLVGSLAGAGPASGKKRDEKPLIDSSDLRPLADDYAKALAAYKTHEALMKAAKQPILDIVVPARLAHCVRSHQVVTSFSVCGRLTFTTTDRYSNVPAERSAALEAAFSESFPAYFSPTLKISLNESSANDETVLATMLQRLGKEFFAEHFLVKRDLVVQDRFHADYSVREDIQAIAQPFIAEQTIKPYEPQLKIS